MWVWFIVLMSEEPRGINVKREAENSPAFDEKWKDAHPGREARSESIGVVMQRWSKFISDESIENALSFVPQEGDVFVATHSKAGTTMMQQICHQLRSNGDIDFEEISVVVPWLEMAHDVGTDLNAPQKYSPRVFKTHFDWPSVPKSFNEKVCMFSCFHALLSTITGRTCR